MDGGGSSNLVVREAGIDSKAVVKNSPSGGSLRKTTNGLFLVYAGNGSSSPLVSPILNPSPAVAPPPPMQLEQPLMDALREHLPAGMADKYRIQVIVKMDPNSVESEAPAVCRPDSSQSL